MIQLTNTLSNRINTKTFFSSPSFKSEEKGNKKNNNSNSIMDYLESSAVANTPVVKKNIKQKNGQ